MKKKKFLVEGDLSSSSFNDVANFVLGLYKKVFDDAELEISKGRPVASIHIRPGFEDSDPAIMKQTNHSLVSALKSNGFVPTTGQFNAIYLKNDADVRVSLNKGGVADSKGTIAVIKGTQNEVTSRRVTVTRGMLTGLIRESLSRANVGGRAQVSRATDRKSLRESLGPGSNEPLWDIEVTDLLEFADAWASLGNAVRDQVRHVLDDPTDQGVNPNAIVLARERLEGFNSELDDILNSWFDDFSIDENDDDDLPEEDEGGPIVV